MSPTVPVVGGFGSGGVLGFAAAAAGLYWQCDGGAASGAESPDPETTK